MDLEDRFAAGLAAADWLRPGARLLAAVSGGGDSLALLELLREAAAARGASLSAAYVDHRTRPETADEARFVAAHAGRAGLAFHACALPAEVGGAGEAQLRRARLDALAALARQAGADVVLLGHQADDVVETMVMRLLRGTGIDGLCGIRAAVGPFRRPLLGFRRAELRAWLEARGVGWIDDPTNADVRRLRARVRHRVLPALRLGRPDVDALLWDAAARMTGLRRGLERWEAEWLSGKAVRSAGGVGLPVAELRREPLVLRGRLVRRAAEWCGLEASRLGRGCLVEAVRVASADAAPRAAVPLPGGLGAAVRGGRLWVRGRWPPLVRPGPPC
jgi:tRNA(Ile)-lysidine synthase